MNADPYNLQRFVDAQDPVIERVLEELAAGRKRTHWMWFVFPQLAGLGRSPTARFYALASFDEARAYLAHPLLGPRLKACARAVAAHVGQSARAIFGAPDDLKLRSSLTLFEAADPTAAEFGAALDAVCDGVRDPATLQMIGSAR